MKNCIGIIGGNNTTEDLLKLAEQVGNEVAKSGFVLICGGRGGVMEAACKGAKTAGGVTVGVLPGDFREEANKFVDIPIVTGMGVGRNIVVVRSSQAVIAIDGKYGTLSEIAYALQLEIPVIGLRTWEFSDKINIVEGPKEAVELAKNLIIT